MADAAVVDDRNVPSPPPVDPSQGAEQNGADPVEKPTAPDSSPQPLPTDFVLPPPVRSINAAQVYGLGMDAWKEAATAAGENKQAEAKAKWEEAKEHFTKLTAASSSPTHVQVAHYFLAAGYFTYEGNYQKALDHFTQFAGAGQTTGTDAETTQIAEFCGQNLATVPINVAACNMRLKRWKEACAAYEQYLQDNPNGDLRLTALNELADAYFEQFKAAAADNTELKVSCLKKAAQNYEASLAEDTEGLLTEENRFFLAECYAFLGRLTQGDAGEETDYIGLSRTQYQEVIALGGDRKDVASKRLGELNTSVGAYIDALSTLPENSPEWAEAKLKQARVYHDNNQYKEAIDFIDSALASGALKKEPIVLSSLLVKAQSHLAVARQLRKDTGSEADQTAAIQEQCEQAAAAATTALTDFPEEADAKQTLIDDRADALSIRAEANSILAQMSTDAEQQKTLLASVEQDLSVLASLRDRVSDKAEIDNAFRDLGLMAEKADNLELAEHRFISAGEVALEDVARVQFKQKKYEEASDSYKNAMDAGTNSELVLRRYVEAPCRWGEQLAEADNRDQAIAAYLIALERGRADAEADSFVPSSAAFFAFEGGLKAIKLLREAGKVVSTGDEASASSVLDALSAKYPKAADRIRANELCQNAFALLGMEVSAENRAAHDKLVNQAMEAVIAEAPQSLAADEARMVLGPRYFTAGDYDAAKAQFTALIQSKKYGEVALQNLMHVSFRQGDWETVLQSAQQLVAIPDSRFSTEAQIRLAQAYLAKDDIAAASAEIDKLDQASVEARLLRGEQYARSAEMCITDEDYEKARAYLESVGQKSVAAGSEIAMEAYVRIGDTYQLEGNLVIAARRYNEAARLSTELAQALEGRSVDPGISDEAREIITGRIAAFKKIAETALTKAAECAPASDKAAE